jgi:uncharacterized protein YerC
MQSKTDFLNDPEFKRRKAEALKTMNDFPSVLEYRQHVYRFADDLCTAIVKAADADKAQSLARSIEDVLENYNISVVIFAVAAVVESFARSFEGYSNPTIIYAGFMKIVDEIHQFRSETKENDNGK